VLRSRRDLAGPPFMSPPAQRRPMRMGHLGRLGLVDLPVDVIVVLEQQKRASQAEGIERALSER
jgi:hypothetical protein